MISDQSEQLRGNSGEEKFQQGWGCLEQETDRQDRWGMEAPGFPCAMLHQPASIGGSWEAATFEWKVEAAG